MVYAGEIAVAVGLKDTVTGDTLCDEQHPIILEAVEFPEPVIDQAVEPKTQADQDKLGVAPSAREEDPTFRGYTDPESGQTIIQGMGELHLEVIIDRLLRSLRSRRTSAGPRSPIARRFARRCNRKGSSLARPAAAVSTATCSSRSSRTSRAAGSSLKNRIVGGVVPRESYGRRGGRPRSNAERRIAGYPVVDVKVALYDGSYHDVDSSEMAFKIAASMAFKEAMAKANPVLLELTGGRGNDTRGVDGRRWVT